VVGEPTVNGPTGDDNDDSWIGVAGGVQPPPRDEDVGLGGGSRKRIFPEGEGDRLRDVYGDVLPAANLETSVPQDDASVGVVGRDRVAVVNDDDWIPPSVAPPRRYDDDGRGGGLRNRDEPLLLAMPPALRRVVAAAAVSPPPSPPPPPPRGSTESKLAAAGIVPGVANNLPLASTELESADAAVGGFHDE
jgi:hypothetical protein